MIAGRSLSDISNTWSVTASAVNIITTAALIFITKNDGGFKKLINYEKGKTAAKQAVGMSVLILFLGMGGMYLAGFLCYGKIPYATDDDSTDTYSSCSDQSHCSSRQYGACRGQHLSRLRSKHDQKQILISDFSVFLLCTSALLYSDTAGCKVYGLPFPVIPSSYDSSLHHIQEKQKPDSHYDRSCNHRFVDSRADSGNIGNPRIL